MTEREALLGSIEMVEVQRRDAAVITANTTAASRLFDQQPLHLASTTGNRLGATSGTPIAPLGAAPELGHAVVLAFKRQLLLAVFGGTAPLSPSGSQTVLPELMPHGRFAAIKSLRDLGCRHPRIDQRFEFRACHPASRRMLTPVDGLEAVLPDPVADRRFM
jgi:hypothetical protein